jgi:membrane-associated phospholipid phosphatase
MSMVLPTLVNKKNRVIAGFLLFASTAILYLTPNHFHIFGPRFLPLSRIDLAVPFVPQTVWLYVSEYFYLAMVYLSYRNILNLNRFVYALFSLQVCCALVFLFWPTTMSREMFPVPENLDPVTALVLKALRRVDSPANCFPSFHVGSVYLACFLLFNEGYRKFGFFLLWATAISVSTLTLKQHYFVDVVSGFGMAVILYFLFRDARFKSMPAGSERL